MVSSESTPSESAADGQSLSAWQKRIASRLRRGLPPYTETRLAAEKKRGPRPRFRRPSIEARVAYVAELKLSRGCADCGYNAHPAALDFDHLPGAIKIDTIARLATYADLDVLQVEMAKCEVVCANCHRVRESNRRAARKAVHVEQHVLVTTAKEQQRASLRSTQTCRHCKAMLTEPRKGLCHACYEYLRRTGRDRPAQG